MPLKARHWQITPQVSSAVIARLPHLHPLLVQILFNRGITTPEQVEQFLAPDSLVGNPFSMRGMPQAVERLRQGMRANEKIAVYGDFDVDGVTATALVVQALSAFGANVIPYIPHRIEEGYGLNRDALAQLKEEGTRVVVTVDCGVRSLDEVAFGTSIGLDMIVTDHHAPGDELPRSLAVVNPKQRGCPYPYKELSGSGVAFKLAQALVRAEENLPVNDRLRLNAGVLAEKDLLDLVALGTVADLVPLTGENRALVRLGLDQLRQTERPGIQAMLRYAGVKTDSIGAGTIGYILGPRLNAAGRLEHALEAYDLLSTQYPDEADALAQKLENTNRERQRLTVELTTKAQQAVVANAGTAHLLFVGAPEFPEGIVGLIASRLSEEFYRPAVAVHVGQEESRGSARSIPDFNIVSALDQCRDLLVRHGGHSMAAGFTVRNSNLGQIEARLKEIAARALTGSELVPTLMVDAETRLTEMGSGLLQSLKLLQPFGYGNREPLFLSRHVGVREGRVVGNGHLKLTLADGQTIWDAIAFGQGEWATKLPKRIDVVYELEENVWRGETRMQLNVRDLRPSDE